MLLKFKTKKLFIIAYVMEYPLPSKKKKGKRKKTENICEKKYLYTLFYPGHGMVVYFTEILKKIQYLCSFYTFIRRTLTRISTSLLSLLCSLFLGIDSITFCGSFASCITFRRTKEVKFYI